MRSGRIAVVVVTAATVVVATAAAVRYDGPTTPGRGTAAAGPAPNAPRDRTVELLTALLASVPVLPGAIRRDTAPTPSLAQPSSEPASANLLDRHEWWTAPGSADAVLAYFHAHPPRGTTFSGTATSGNTRTGAVGASSLSYDALDTSYAREVQAQVSVVAFHGGVALRADAQAIWVPARDPGTRIVGPTSVAVTVLRARTPRGPGAPTVRRTLTGHDAAVLADVVNTLPVTTPGFTSCPADFPGLTDTLGFATRSGAVAVVADLTGCAGVQVRPPHGRAHFFGAGGLDATLMRLLGLPKNYGQ